MLESEQMELKMLEFELKVLESEDEVLRTELKVLESELKVSLFCIFYYCPLLVPPWSKDLYPFEPFS